MTEANQSHQQASPTQASNRQTRLQYHRFWTGLGVVQLVVLCWLSLTPLPAPPIGIDHGDLLLHLTAYGVLSFYFFQLFEARHAPRIALSLITYGALMEAGQELLTTYRDANWLDFIANTLGVVLGYFLNRITKPVNLFALVEKHVRNMLD